MSIISEVPAHVAGRGLARDIARTAGAGSASVPPTTPPAIHPLLETVFTTFNAEGITWCVLRSVEELAVPGGDVDLLVERVHMEHACELLNRLGFVELRSWGRGTHRFFLTYHAPTDRWIKLDIVTELSFGPRFDLHTSAERGALSRRRRVGSTATLSAEDAFWVLLLHSMLDRPHFARKHGAQLRALATNATSTGELAAIVSLHCPNGWSAERLLTETRAASWDLLDNVRSRLIATWESDEGTPRWAHFRQRIAPVVERFAQLRSRRGVTVALLGPDGSGKSTLSTGIQEQFYFPTRSVYMGLWQRSSRSINIPILPIATRPLLIWSRYLRAQRHTLLGRLVVFDRYTYDALISPQPPFVTLKRIYFWCLAHACPGPDLVVVLDVPGEVAHARKGEFDPTRLGEVRNEYRLLADRLPNAVIVDAAQSSVSVRVVVTDRIWWHYVTRIGTH
jgi:thymidylate kinase